MSNQANTHASDRERTAQPRRGTLAIVDAMQAIVATERLCARALWAPDVALTIVVEQAFGETVELLGSDVDGAREAIAACEAVVAKGGRAAAVLSASSLSDARRELGGLADRRRPVVIHVIIAPKGRDATAANYADLHAVTDVGVGVLYARDAQDASDLVVVAHRAAEDAEAPILVVHDGYPASYAHDRVVLPDAPLVRAALEPAPPPLSQ